MAPYMILIVSIGVIGFVLCEMYPSRRNDIILLVAATLAMFVLSVLRDSRVGRDYRMYLQYFGLVCKGGWGYLLSSDNIYLSEFGYSLFNWLISLLGSSQVLFASATAALMLGLNAVFLYKYSSSVWMSLYVFVSYGFFGYTLCTIRQQIAIAIFMFALPYLQKKRFWPYLLIVLLASSFHNSLLVCIPVYFFAQLQINWKSLSLYAACTVFVLLFSEPIFNLITRYIYKDYTVGSYFMQGRDLITLVIPAVTAAGAVLLKGPLLKRNPGNLPLINLVLYAGLLFVLTMKHFIFQRVALIFLPAALLLLPEMMNSVGPEESELLELDRAKALSGTRGRNRRTEQASYLGLKAEMKSKLTMYYSAMGMIIFFGLMYSGFLLNANRLVIRPYTTFFGS